METDEQARNRFQAELEFVQCLANPNYLNFEVRDSCDTYGNSVATTEKGPVRKSWDFMDYYHSKYVPSLWSQLFYLLAQRGYLRERPFINYLKYLLYWKEPDYAKFLKYPHCLHMLELLQYEHFRKELVNAQCAKFIDEQQLLHWQHYSRKRTRLQQALAEQQQQQAPAHGNAVTK